MADSTAQVRHLGEAGLNWFVYCSVQGQWGKACRHVSAERLMKWDSTSSDTMFSSRRDDPDEGSYASDFRGGRAERWV